MPPAPLSIHNNSSPLILTQKKKRKEESEEEDSDDPGQDEVEDVDNASGGDHELLSSRTISLILVLQMSWTLRTLLQDPGGVVQLLPQLLLRLRRRRQIDHPRLPMTRTATSQNLRRTLIL